MPGRLNDERGGFVVATRGAHIHPRTNRRLPTYGSPARVAHQRGGDVPERAAISTWASTRQPRGHPSLASRV